MTGHKNKASKLFQGQEYKSCPRSKTKPINSLGQAFGSPQKWEQQSGDCLLHFLECSCFIPFNFHISLQITSFKKTHEGLDISILYTYIIFASGSPDCNLCLFVCNISCSRHFCILFLKKSEHYGAKFEGIHKPRDKRIPDRELVQEMWIRLFPIKMQTKWTSLPPLIKAKLMFFMPS